jgi:U6 snRNA-associated Sm-like protein LSm1
MEEQEVVADDFQYLPGAAGLIGQLDTQILIVLKDGRNLVGTLRSFDQYMNLVLDSTSERIVVDGKT